MIFDEDGMARRRLLLGHLVMLGDVRGMRETMGRIAREAACLSARERLDLPQVSDPRCQPLRAAWGVGPVGDRKRTPCAEPTV